MRFIGEFLSWRSTLTGRCNPESGQQAIAHQQEKNGYENRGIHVTDRIFRTSGLTGR
jgi:hypothetical protein